MDFLSPLIWGQLLTIWIMAVALGLDALSLGLGIGMRGVRKRTILKIGSITALFHILMPLAGMTMGGYLSAILGHIATICGGVLLALLGAHMVYASFRAGEERPINYSSLWGIILFSFSVSVDSFSVGVSLGMFAGDRTLTVLMFGAMGGVMSIAGLLLGRRMGRWVGDYGEAMGGVILLAFGLMFIL